MRYMGIDYGSKKIGVALSDELGTMGFPFEVLPNDARLSDALALVIESKQVSTVVIGYSRDLSGDLNPIANPACALGEELAARTGVDVDYESEVYSTQEARRSIEGIYQPPKHSGVVDDKAAALILTSYLSRHGRKN